MRFAQYEAPPVEKSIRIAYRPRNGVVSALPRFQNDPRSLPHFKVIVRIDEDRLLECSFANLVIANPRE